MVINNLENQGARLKPHAMVITVILVIEGKWRGIFVFLGNNSDLYTSLTTKK
jgi:hypothetical protein